MKVGTTTAKAMSHGLNSRGLVIAVAAEAAG